MFEQLSLWLGNGVNTIVGFAGGILVFTFIGIITQRWHEWKLRKYARLQLKELQEIKIAIERGGKNGFDTSRKYKQASKEGVQSGQGVRAQGARGK